MRHKYDTRGIILGRAHVGEANSSITILTEELGLVRARAQGVRKPGAKLAAALTTFSESTLMLVRGKEGWRLIGAVREEDWFARLTPEARGRAARVAQLLLRLVAGEVPDAALFPVIRNFLMVLSAEPASMHEAAEVLAVLQMLAALGLDAGDLPEGADRFTETALMAVAQDRPRMIARVNTGIAASGL